MNTPLARTLVAAALGLAACNSASDPAAPAPDKPAQSVAAEPAAPPPPAQVPAASVAPAIPRPVAVQDEGTPSASAVTVEIASVTLGEDCDATGARAAPPPPASVPRGESPIPGAAGAAAAERAGPGGAGAMAKRARPACEQTSVQLSLRAGPGAASPSIEIRQVRLTDASGVVLGSLVPRAPMVWSPEGAYVPWNQVIEPGQALSVGYSLSAPDWGKIPDRYSKRYVIELVVAVGGQEQSVTREVRVSAPTILPPNVAT